MGPGSRLHQTALLVDRDGAAGSLTASGLGIAWSSADPRAYGPAAPETLPSKRITPEDAGLRGSSAAAPVAGGGPRSRVITRAPAQLVVGPADSDGARATWSAVTRSLRITESQGLVSLLA